MTRTGIIIGGPIDGHRLSYEGEIWDYHKTPESLTRPIDYSDMTATQAAMRATSEVGRYYYTDLTVLGYYDNPRRIGFWVEQGVVDAQLRELTRSVLKAVVDAAWQSVQNQIDEEGCGAAFAAMKEWKE